MDKNVDYYIALVGKNPLPNYISVLSYCNSKTKVFFVHTMEAEDSISTRPVAKNIEIALEKKLESIWVETVECNKSDTSAINKTIVYILDRIKDLADYEHLYDKKIKILLDYTGATKIMAAAFYSYFAEISEKFENITFMSSYVSSGTKLVYEATFGSVEILNKYKISTIAEKYNITAEDIINLHGYEMKREKESISIIDDKGNLKDFPICEVKNTDFTLELGFKLVKHKRGGKEYYRKQDYFQMNDIADKLGGTEANVNIYIEEEMDENWKVDFYESISNISDIDIKSKVKILILEGKI